MREPDVPAQPPDLPSDVEHELINSLASIVGFSQLIRRDPSLPEDLRQNAALLVEEATRTRRIVQDLLDLARQGRSARPPTAVRVPIDNELGSESESESATRTTTGTRPRVLVLEDDPSLGVYLEKALSILGYEPLVTARGQDAVERAAEGDFAVCLFDHQMAGMSGIEAYEAVVAIRPDLARRFVMMSGDVLDPALETFAAAQPIRLLTKPFDLDGLDGTIRGVMKKTGQSRG